MRRDESGAHGRRDNADAIAAAGIGQPVRRKEDERLLRGQGRYSDDINLPSQAHAIMVRSPHAHARILGIDATSALAMPGVLAVLTGVDAMADGLQRIPHARSPQSPPDIALNNRDGSARRITPHLVLPTEKVRHVGEGVAVVIAESIDAAKDGAERVRVAYEALSAVTATAAAASPEAPQVWDDAAGNLCIDAEVGDAARIDAEVGDAARTDAAFAHAAHIVRLDTWIPRATGVPLEPRAAVGVHDPTTGRYTLYAGSGGVVRQKHEIAVILGVPPERVRVVAQDVGGNFGTRNSLYPEFALVVWAARRLGRPVKWVCERQEAFLSDYQARDLVVEAELALDREGNFLALRGANLSNLGAHTVSFVAITKGAGLMTSIYHIPTAYFRARAVLSHTPPTHPFRSTGRPEAMFVIERLIDLAARQCGFDRIALRRRNLIAEAALPYANPLGLTYDSGAYHRALEAALVLGDWAGFPQRREESRRRGRHRGIGVANYIEVTTGAPRERAEITVLPGGGIEIVIGTLSSGQGHETSFAQLLTEWLRVPHRCIRLVTGDTDLVPVGGGSHSGRSMRLAGIVLGKATDILIAKGKRIAAHLFETAESDVVFAEGRFVVAGTDRSLDIFEIAAAAQTRNDLPSDLQGRFAAESDETVLVAGFPYGCHVCEVEIDAETGTVDLLRYAAVDDVGKAINPMILHGQAHGGIAQGLGHALSEQCIYDATGQLLSGSFLDYAVPRADRLCSFATEISEVPSPTNRLGIRAGGEGGTTPTLGVIANAIVDALAEFGVRHIELPATSERVWRAIRSARP